MKRFFFDEDGAVTVDWVVLTASIIFFSVAVFGVIYEASMDSTASVGETLQDY